MTDKDFSEKIKKKRRRRLLSAIIIGVMVMLALIAIIIHGPAKRTSDADSEVTISISCGNLTDDPGRLNDKALLEYIPEDGWILQETKCEITAGKTTVLDVLLRVCGEKDIQIEVENNPAYGSYVKGIGYLYEFSAGKYSGWMFSVNGEDAAYSADKIILRGGESIYWYYVVDL